MTTEKKVKKNDGRTNDLSFGWLTSAYGEEWAQWRNYAAEWISGQHKSTANKRRALTVFLKAIFLMTRHTVQM